MRNLSSGLIDDFVQHTEKNASTADSDEKFCKGTFKNNALEIYISYNNYNIRKSQLTNIVWHVNLK